VSKYVAYFKNQENCGLVGRILASFWKSEFPRGEAEDSRSITPGLSNLLDAWQLERALFLESSAHSLALL
jgi:hypothetical protein